MRLTLEDRAILCSNKRGTSNQEYMDVWTTRYVLTRKQGVANCVRERINRRHSIGGAAVSGIDAVY